MISASSWTGLGMRWTPRAVSAEWDQEDGRSGRRGWKDSQGGEENKGEENDNLSKLGRHSSAVVCPELLRRCGNWRRPWDATAPLWSARRCEWMKNLMNGWKTWWMDEKSDELTKSLARVKLMNWWRIWLIDEWSDELVKGLVTGIKVHELVNRCKNGPMIWWID